MTENDINIGVIGSGAVGGVFSIMLSNLGYNLEFAYQHSGEVQIDNRILMNTRGAFGDLDYLVKKVDSPNKFTSKKDIVFLVSKADSIEEGARECMENLKKDGIVILISNVLNLSLVEKYIPKSKIIGLFLDWSCQRDSSVQMRVTEGGGMYIGVFDVNAQPYLSIIKKILDSIAPTQIIDNMNEFIVSRVIINSTISAIGAICGLRLGKFLKTKYGRALFIELVREAVMVFEAAGTKIIPYNNQIDYYKFKEHYLSSKRYIKKILNIIANNNLHMYSSILRDLERNKRTEVDVLIGKIVKLAEERKIRVPFTKLVYTTILDIEKGENTIREELLREIFYTAKSKKNKKEV